MENDCISTGSSVKLIYFFVLLLSKKRNKRIKMNYPTDLSMWWKKDELSAIQKTDPDKLVPGKEYILIYESLHYTGTFLRSHIQFPKYKYFIVKGKQRMFGSGFSNYEVGKLLVSYFDEITQLLPEDLLYHIQDFL